MKPPPSPLTEHPVEKLWDFVSGAAVDGSMTGKLVCARGRPSVGRMAFSTDDGRRWSVHVDEITRAE